MTITPQEALTRCIEYRETFHDKTLYLMWLIMHSRMSPVMAAALTMGLRVKKETIGETAATVAIMREFATKADVPTEVSDHFVDTVGMSGDGANTFNIPTASMLAAAAAGTCIAKHGGRGVSSKSDSVDMLEALGVNIMFTPEQVAELIETVGIGSMFAPNYHPAMKNAVPIHKELDVRMIFNTLRPLTNPAGAPNILMGVFYPDLVGIQVCVMQRLGAKHVAVVHGKDDTDEVSLGVTTLVGELRDGVVIEYEIHPEDFRLQMVSNRSLKVAGADESKTMLIEALESRPGTPCETVSPDASAALYVANIVGSIDDDMKLACEAIISGAACARPGELVRVTNQFKV